MKEIKQHPTFIRGKLVEQEAYLVYGQNLLFDKTLGNYGTLPLHKTWHSGNRLIFIEEGTVDVVVVGPEAADHW
jgi:hypothetical protein